MKRRVTSCFRRSGKRGETMVEVLVAFTLLAIFLLMFSQGIVYATKSEANAANNRSAADSAMEDLQNKLSQYSEDDADDESKAGHLSSPEILIGENIIAPYTYSVNGYKYVVYRTKEG